MEIFLTTYGKGGPHREMGSPTTQITGQGIKVQGLAAKCFPQLPGTLGQGIGGMRRKRNHVTS